MMKNTGNCLCGKVKFLVNKDIQIIYHCYCSLCRKQSGTGSNTATLVKDSLFQWCSGKEFIGTFKKESGFTACFCTVCGSPVPNRVGESTLVWIPIGLLNETIMPTKKLGFCMSSRKDWVPQNHNDEEYLELPSWDKLTDYFD